MQIEANICSHLFPPIFFFLLKWHFIIITFLFFHFLHSLPLYGCPMIFPASPLSLSHWGKRHFRQHGRWCGGGEHGVSQVAGGTREEPAPPVRVEEGVLRVQGQKGGGRRLRAEGTA